jgi:hypothetical protein
MLSHLGPLVPGERPTELFGQRPDHPGDLVADGLGAVTRERWPVLHPWLLTAAFGLAAEPPPAPVLPAA